MPLESLEASWFRRHNGEMVEMNEPQVWTLISVFSVAIFGMLGVVSLFARLLRAEIGKVGVQIDGLRRSQRPLRRAEREVRRDRSRREQVTRGR